MILMARPIVKLSIQPGVSESVSPSREENGSSAGGRTRRGATGGRRTGLGIRCSAAAGGSNFGRGTWILGGGSAAAFGMATVTTEFSEVSAGGGPGRTKERFKG